MKNILVIGRCWKFLDFLIPTIDSIIDHNYCADLIIVDSLSSRSQGIYSYCKRLLKNKDILGFISSDANLLGNVWHINQYLVDIIRRYEYVCLTDMDLKLRNPYHNWLEKATGILARNSNIGAVSGDLEPMPPISDLFIHTSNVSDVKMAGEDFWKMDTDGWFYTVRSSEFLTFLKTGGRTHPPGGGTQKQFGPGMHGYSQFCKENDKLEGRTNLSFFHYGWLRFVHEEWNAAYNEMGMSFACDTYEKLRDCNVQFYMLQGNWNNDVKVPTKESFKIELNKN